MSDYYKYSFTSPQSIYAVIHEELDSYFSVGVISDLLFPLYTERCLRKLGRGTYKIKNGLVIVDNYTGNLPEGFKYVRELWATTSCTDSYTLPGSVFQELSFKLCDYDENVSCDKCQDCVAPNTIKAVYRTTNEVIYETQYTYLLEPGNIHAEGFCKDSPNLKSNSGNKFDIRDNKLIVEFPQGILYLTYYVEELTEEGYQLIPDDYSIQEYIEAYIKAKMFETISNSVTDETYNQVQQKAQKYKQEADEKYILATIQQRKPTIQQTAQAVYRDRRRMNKYLL